jgi:hypothetical protein
MARTHQPSSGKTSAKAAMRETPVNLAQPKKRPLLLALSIVLLLAWLAFMAAMAWRSLT